VVDKESAARAAVEAVLENIKAQAAEESGRAIPKDDGTRRDRRAEHDKVASPREG